VFVRTWQVGVKERRTLPKEGGPEIVWKLYKALDDFYVEGVVRILAGSQRADERDSPATLRRCFLHHRPDVSKRLRGDFNLLTALTRQLWRLEALKANTIQV
jgi:hypothetical protein